MNFGLMDPIGWLKMKKIDLQADLNAYLLNQKYCSSKIYWSSDEVSFVGLGECNHYPQVHSDLKR